MIGFCCGWRVRGGNEEVGVRRYVWMHECTNKCVNVCVNVWLNKSVYVLMNVWIYMYVYMSICSISFENFKLTLREILYSQQVFDNEAILQDTRKNFWSAIEVSWILFIGCWSIMLKINHLEKCLNSPPFFDMFNFISHLCKESNRYKIFNSELNLYLNCILNSYYVFTHALQNAFVSNHFSYLYLRINVYIYVYVCILFIIYIYI